MSTFDDAKRAIVGGLEELREAIAAEARVRERRIAICRSRLRVVRAYLERQPILDVREALDALYEADADLGP